MGDLGGGSLEQLCVSCWGPSGRASTWECRAAQSQQAPPEEAQEPSWGTASQGGRCASSVVQRLANGARGWYDVQCEGPRGQAALCLRYVQPAGGRYAYPVPTARRPWGVAYVSARACAWRWPPKPHPNLTGGALTVLARLAIASFCVTYSTSAMPLAIFCSW